jgi:hypothetical protein
VELTLETPAAVAQPLPTPTLPSAPTASPLPLPLPSSETAEAAPLLTPATPPVAEAPVVMDQAVGEQVTLFEDCVSIVVNNVTRYIPYPAFFEALKARVEGEGVDSSGSCKGISLPRGCTWFGQKGPVMELNVLVPACTREVNFRGRKYKIPVPNVLIYFKIENRSSKLHVVAVKYFCTDREGGAVPTSLITRIDANQRVWLLPMPNTYAEANMCYGENSMPYEQPLDNLRGLSWFYEYMFASPFNNDLGVKALASNREDGEAWFKYLAKLSTEGKPFPYSRLYGYKSVDGSTGEDTSPLSN